MKNGGDVSPFFVYYIPIMEFAEIARLVIHFSSPRMGLRRNYFSVTLIFESTKVIYKKIRLGGATKEYPDIIVEKDLDEKGKSDYALLVNLALRSPTHRRRPKIYDMSPRYVEIFDSKGNVEINMIDDQSFWEVARMYRETLAK